MFFFNFLNVFKIFFCYLFVIFCYVFFIFNVFVLFNVMLFVFVKSLE